MTAPIGLGQKVKITDAGSIYAFCEPAAKDFGLKNYNHGYGLNVTNGATGTIASEAKHYSQADATLIGIDLDDGNSIVVDVNGISTL